MANGKIRRFCTRQPYVHHDPKIVDDPTKKYDGPFNSDIWCKKIIRDVGSDDHIVAPPFDEPIIVGMNYNPEFLWQNHLRDKYFHP